MYRALIVLVLASLALSSCASCSGMISAAKLTKPASAEQSAAGGAAAPEVGMQSVATNPRGFDWIDSKEPERAAGSRNSK
ncbi:MAG TPA: hypothetical protein VHZ53_11465 [Steroidobacteraceae bacterium]|jgi:hypothetical protein|nr:hypothetical protein [Steroidobacteraceae bacterium]